MVITALTKLSPVNSQTIAYPNLPNYAQIPNESNSVDMIDYFHSLQERYEKGEGAALGRLLFGGYSRRYDRHDENMADEQDELEEAMEEIKATEAEEDSEDSPDNTETGSDNMSQKDDSSDIDSQSVTITESRTITISDTEISDTPSQTDDEQLQCGALAAIQAECDIASGGNDADAQICLEQKYAQQFENSDIDLLSCQSTSM